MKADPRGVVIALRRAERDGDVALADFLAYEIVRHLNCLDAIEESNPDLVEAHMGEFALGDPP